MDATTTIATDPPFRRRLALPGRRPLIAGAVAAAVAVGGAIWLGMPASGTSTDDAYIAADATTVAPRVRGFVAQVLVKDNQRVREGQPLVRIDGEEFDSRVAAAEGELADAKAQLAAARASLGSLAAEEDLASANTASAQTTIRSADAEAARAGADRRRYEALVAAGAVSRADAERAGVTAVAAAEEARKTRALLAVATRSAEVTSAKRPERLAAIATAEARVRKAQAALDLARQDQSHTIIRAPIGGVVGNRQTRVGDYVQPGTRLMTLVPVDEIYVTANFKETQTGRMLPGQHARIKVDALGGETLRGSVDSIAPGSGSTFALLPFEPGTGNFTKIVQRVPVRIRFDPGQPALAKLRPGLSVTATVDFRRAL